MPAGSALQIEIEFNAAGLEAGVYRRDIVINSNDPQQLSRVVPVQLTVSGIPNIAVDPVGSVTNLGIVWSGMVQTGAVRIVNSGSDVLNVSSISSDNPAWTVPAGGFLLAAGEVQTIPVRFTASAVGVSVVNLAVLSNDPDQPSAPVRMLADSRYPGIISVDTSPISTNLYLGQAATRVLRIFNTGLGSMDFSLRFEYGLQYYVWRDSGMAGGPTYACVGQEQRVRGVASTRSLSWSECLS